MSLWRSGWSFIDSNQGRIAAIAAIWTEIAAAVWNMHLKQPVDLGSLGAGLAAILTASAAPPAARAFLAHAQLKLARAQPLRDEGDAL